MRSSLATRCFSLALCFVFLCELRGQLLANNEMSAQLRRAIRTHQQAARYVQPADCLLPSLSECAVGSTVSVLSVDAW